MPRSRTFATIAATTLAVISLAACGGSPSAEQAPEQEVPATQENENPHYIDVEQVSLPDGRTVTCVIQGAGHRGGLDCDWDNAQ